ncbi:MAG: hypothetical protein WCD23_04860, partial [Candidatus Acidiferrales bacterium]
MSERLSEPMIDSTTSIVEIGSSCEALAIEACSNSGEQPAPRAPEIVVAMSGGVDSSTVAALLHSRGVAIVGLTMQLWNQRRLPELQNAGGPAQHRCCSLDDVYDARRVAEHLSIP